ncbi:MAG: efflux RND transporter permease subunit [Planctomycetaceae bacterium]
MTGLLAGAARRPVAVSMVVAAVVVFGAVSYGRLDLSLLPSLNVPTLTVRTEFPGAGPRDVDERVTEVLEKRLATTNGLLAISSVSRGSLSDITLEFRADADMGEVRSEIDSKIDAAMLPETTKRPLVLPYDPDLDPILRIAVSSRGKTESDLAVARKLAEEEVEKELKKLPGVAAARIRGGRQREVAVTLDESALRRTGISLAQVAAALTAGNRNEAAGTIAEGTIEYVVRSVNELRDAREIAALPVATAAGVPVRVGDLGRLEETFREREMAAYLDGREAVLVEIYKKADASLVTVARAVRERLVSGSGQRGLAETLEEWVTLRVLSDQSRFIEGAVHEVRDTAVLGGFLAVFILYLFLRHATSTFLSAGVIGICVVATFAPMFLAGISLNVMSLGGLALGVGMLVDNAIVVLEASARRRARGESAAAAAVGGVRDVAGAITASTLTTVCVFFPVVFLGQAGLVGQIFRDLALTIVFSILISLLVALFVIPTFLALAPGRSSGRRGAPRRHARFGWAGTLVSDRTAVAWARLPRRALLGRLWHGSWLLLALPFALLQRALGLLFSLLLLVGALLFLGASRLARALLGPLAAGFQRGYAFLERGYPIVLDACLARPRAVLLVTAALVAVTVERASTLSPDLLPESLTGEFDVTVSFPAGTPLERTAARMLPVEEEVRRLEGVEWVATLAGVEADADRAADEGEHTARLTVHLRKGAGGDGTEARVREEVRRLVVRVPDAQPPRFLASALFRFALPLRIVFSGGEGDLPRLGRAAEEAAVGLRAFAGVKNVQVSLGRGAREVRLLLDRDALFRNGLTVEQVAGRLRAKIEGLVPTALVEGSTRTGVRVRLQEMDRDTLRRLTDMDISAEGAAPLPLLAVLLGPPEVAEGPGEIRRVSGRHAALVTADYDGFDLGALTAQAEAMARPVAERQRVDVEVAGRSREAEKTSRALLLALGLAVFLVYAVMAAQFESFLQPLLIMISLPLAGIGTVWALVALALPVSVVVLLGAILLAGIAVNNAIVLLDCINRRRAEGLTVREAIDAAARERLRPILMTSATTILGLLPLTGLLAGIPGAESLPLGLGGGDAAELRAPMAITVIGGLFSSTALTLLLIPVLALLAAGRRGAARAPEAVA